VARIAALTNNLDASCGRTFKKNEKKWEIFFDPPFHGVFFGRWAGRRRPGSAKIRLAEAREDAYCEGLMGRQWLHAKRAVASQKKSQATGKLVKEIMVAAKFGGADPDSNARLAAALERARRESVSKDAIDRAIRKGAGVGDEKMVLDHVVFEGYAPHKVPVLVEVYTDNQNRTAPEIRVLFKKGQLGTPGSNKFLFDHVGLVEAFHTDPGMDMEEAAIEAGANDVEELGHEANDDIPPGTTGARFVTDRTATAAVSKWLSTHGWSVVTSELGYLPKQYPTLTDEEGAETAEFLQALDDNDDVHRVWAAIR